MRTLTFGYSPCPNDTFAFHALTHGVVDAPFRIEPVLLDIEELNRRAHEGTFDLTKLSVGAFAAVGDRYRLSRRGAALGHGVGPLAVAREAVSLADAVRGCVAISGCEANAMVSTTSDEMLQELVNLKRLPQDVLKGWGKRSGGIARNWPMPAKCVAQYRSARRCQMRHVGAAQRCVGRKVA